MLRRVAAVAAAGSMLVMADYAAAGGWASQSVPAKQGLSGRSAGVSCVGSTMCMSVGAFMNSTGKQRALAQVWNGSTWAVKTVPTPVGATNTRLAAVSCTAADACTAVGSYSLPPGPDGGARDQYALVVRWDGAAWTRQSVPRPSGTTKSYLNGVSCTATGGCKAVGGYRNGSVQSGTLAEHWDGTTWRVVPTPNPAGATFSGLNGISCVGANCIAVGGSTSGSGGQSTQPISMRFNGTSWTLKPVAKPAGTALAGLNGVSCTAITACTAVGGSSTGSDCVGTPPGMRWNGTSWTEQATAAKPGRVQRRELTAVSCTVSTKCTAVGPEMDSDPNGHNPLVERWDGATWTTQPAPKPAGRYSAWFNGISCTGGGCTAVGGAGEFGDSGEEGVTLAERQTSTGTTWTPQTTPNGSGALRTDLFDVSCSSATWCVAAGTAYGGTGGVSAAIAHWNGTSWTQKAPGAALATGRNGDRLVGVSCRSASACTAVGSFLAPHPTYPTFMVARPEARRWNGSSWTAKKLPVPADAAWHATLNSVACGSATSCIAVGTYENSSNVYKPFVEHWDGMSWTLKPVPLPSGAVRTELQSVSCSTATACTAVGGYATDVTHLSDKPLAMRWNGTEWTMQDAAVPAGATYAQLRGVSCTATTPMPCTAVGAFSTTSTYGGSLSLTERWDGTSWGLQDAGSFGTPTKISCPTLTSCTSAGGGSGPKGWDGTSWSSKGFMSTYAYGVSCTSAADCTAVGFNERREMVARVFFAGLVLVNGGGTPTASRYSETAAAAPAGPAPAAPGPATSATRAAKVVELR